MENAPLDSNPQAYLEVVLRDRNKRSSKIDPIRVDSAYHNKSEMLISEWKDGTVEIIYNHPRAGLSVANSTLLFQGRRNGDRYFGTAYTFKAGCVPAPYEVSGSKSASREELVLSGSAPRRDPISCDVIGHANRSGHAKLVFNTKFYGDD